MNDQHIHATSTRQRVFNQIQRVSTLTAIALLLFILAVVSGSRTAAHSAHQEEQTLELNGSVQRTLNGSEKHRYKVEVETGQYTRISVMPQVGRLNIKVFFPTGRKMIEVFGENGTPEGAAISIIGEPSGSYRLEVGSDDGKAEGIVYQIVLKESRQATAKDGNLIIAEKYYAEAELLYESAEPDDLRKAIEQYRQSIPFWKAAEDKRGEASSLSSLAYIHHKLGDNKEALRTFEQALPLSKEAQAMRVEADTLNNIGVVFHSQGDYQKALNYFNLALPLLRTINHRRGEATTLNSIAAVHRVLGQATEFQEARHQLLEIFRAERDRGGEARTLNGIALSYLQMEKPDYEKALDYYGKALTIWQELKNDQQMAVTLSNQGNVYRLQGEADKALEFHLKSLSIHTRMAAIRYQVFTLNYISEDYEAKDDLAQAIDYRQRALGLSQQIEDANLTPLTLMGLAKLERRQGDLQPALAHAKEAVDIFEASRANLASPDLRASYLASRRGYYELYIDLLVRLNQQHPSAGYDSAAIQISERARARSLLDILAGIKTDLHHGVDPSLLGRESVLQKQIEENSSRTRLLMRDRARNITQIEALEKSRRIAQEEFDQVRSRIKNSSPQYAALTQPQPINLTEIQRRTLDADTILLEYFLGEERSYLFAITPSRMWTFTLPPRKEIEKVANEVIKYWQVGKFEDQNEFAQRARSYDQFASKCLPQATRLSQILFGQVAPQLGQKRLLIVSDGILHYISFASLPEPMPDAENQAERENGGQKPSISGVPNYTPLIVRHEIAGLPSASTLDLIRQLGADRPQPSKTVAVFADPVFAADDERVVRAKSMPDESVVASRSGKLLESDARRAAEKTRGDNTGKPFLRLIHTRKEALEISSLTPPSQHQTALGFLANRQSVTTFDFTGYRFVHFATHSYFVENQPNLSGIVLSLIDRQGKEQDGFLSLAEIYDLKLPVDMVVLSACQTGLGKRLEGEGIMGMTRGFMYAGAKRAVVSLWEVSDSGTAELMGEFYRQILKKGLSPASALRAAQLSLWRQGRWKSPYYWAGFSLQGDPL